MNGFEKKFIVDPEGRTEEKKLTEDEKTKLNKPEPTDRLRMTDGGSIIRTDRDGNIKKVHVEGKKEQL